MYPAGNMDAPTAFIVVRTVCFRTALEIFMRLKVHTAHAAGNQLSSGRSKCRPLRELVRIKEEELEKRSQAKKKHWSLKPPPARS